MINKCSCRGKDFRYRGVNVRCWTSIAVIDKHPEATDRA